LILHLFILNYLHLPGAPTESYATPVNHCDDPERCYKFCKQSCFLDHRVHFHNTRM